MSEPDQRHPFAPAPEEERLAGYTREGARRWIHPNIERGRFWTLRLAIAVLGIGAFFLVSHIELNGVPLVLLDVSQRRFHLFGATFHPTDNLILVAFGVTAVFTLFSLTALFGRLFCGFFCPHLALLEFVFRPLESLLEGRASHRRYVQDLPPVLAQRLRRLTKWALYGLVAGALSLQLITLFIGPQGTLSVLREPGSHLPLVVFTAIVTGFLFVDMGFFRENICSMACPWGRLQTVLYDRHTLVVAFDAGRGEPRGPISMAEAGDCIDCGRCVRTCPAGIDIRRGMQMECVGCGQCVDACDDMMDKMKRARGLVSYTSLERLDGRATHFFRRRIALYGAIVAVAAGSLVYLLTSRAAADLDILRASKLPFSELPSGEISTTLRFRLTNLSPEDQRFDISLLEPPEGRLDDGHTSLVVAPSEVDNLTLAVVVPRSVFSNGRAEALLRVDGSAGFSERAPFTLLGPYR
jgi:cytochrome c oxidase accessory protein FixG